MELPASWFVVLWYLGIYIAVLASILVVAFLSTLPTAYSHFHPRSLGRDAFSDAHEKSPERSGYAFYNQHKDRNGRLTFDTSVQIVVLGDIGRSPRMQYHALSIAAHGGLVDIIGYAGSDVHPDVSASAFINIIPIPAWPAALQPSNRLLFLLTAPLKVLWQVWSLYHALSHRSAPAKWMLVQNPPSIPTLLVAGLCCRLRNTRLVVDWHNFGYSILALRLGAAHPAVRLAEWYEGAVARRAATAHFCVTHAMARVLQAKWRIAATPLHDRPPAIFQPLTPEQREPFLARCPGTAPYAAALLAGTCRLLVSSTSWTADEDFSLLLDALVRYSSAVEEQQQQQQQQVSAAAAAAAAPLPNLVAIITGRGPQREHYLSRIAALTNAGRLQHVVVTTAWLSAQDYATLLGAADLGVSLHTSSSGVDLPMKVVDMFGTGLPVVGWGAFEAWPELVREGENGRGFDSAERLAEILEELLGGQGERLKVLREGALKECALRWEDEWMPVAGRLFELRP